MSNKRLKAKSEDTLENRLSMRLSDSGVAVVDTHKERMKKLTGAAVSRSQAVESLLAVGDLVWAAVERTGSWSPTALIDAGERSQIATMNDDEDKK
jgi:hypothetical protein